ncbi:fatty-acyl-CoA synthase [Pseudonocardia thermophila]|uniref:Fatty-acyl-CoA synthase n=1 Tax=Pseudonocardia thermophila TaxID=1848 RepID=A0A1M6RYK7_PSETH|nr:long-chain fatty acid--CoA ligase [Pseudonocardia thermophila]SHK37595.1 fatty-acyl-CoA synthase [Pseudonocardia thermophila]
MLGTMMDRPLLVSSLLQHAERVHGDRVNLSCEAGEVRRAFTYRELGSDARRLAAALSELGVQHGTRVGSLAWNSDRHLAAYFGVPGIGAVLHTINQRMPAEHIAYAVNQAEDRVLLVDADLLPVARQIVPATPSVQHVVVLGDGEADIPGVRSWSFDDLIAEAAELATFPELDERTAASICFTSGTTGLPKGVVYTHRSTVLHALAISLSGGVAISPERSYLVACQMSHVNSWGVPHAATMQGARLVLPGPHPSPLDYLKIITRHRPDMLIGAPAVMGLIRHEYLARRGEFDLSSIRTVWMGGQTPPPALVEWWAGHGANTVNGWGMTETHPMATFSQGHTDQGRPLPLVELRVVDEEGVELPWDGRSAGELEARSPWVTGSYLGQTGPSESFHDGWLRTGDVAVIEPDGTLRIKDRFKDLVKSGGEWISSVELENHLMEHPAITEAAVVAVPHEKWQERPVAWLVTATDVTDDELRDFVRSKFPSYWVPDAFVRVDAIPKTSVGKVDKATIRKQQTTSSLAPSAG